MNNNSAEGVDDGIELGQAGTARDGSKVTSIDEALNQLLRPQPLLLTVDYNDPRYDNSSVQTISEHPGETEPTVEPEHPGTSPGRSDRAESHSQSPSERLADANATIEEITALFEAHFNPNDRFSILDIIGVDGTELDVNEAKPGTDSIKAARRIVLRKYADIVRRLELYRTLDSTASDTAEEREAGIRATALLTKIGHAFNAINDESRMVDETSVQRENRSSTPKISSLTLWLEHRASNRELIVDVVSGPNFSIQTLSTVVGRMMRSAGYASLRRDHEKLRDFALQLNENPNLITDAGQRDILLSQFENGEIRGVLRTFCERTVKARQEYEAKAPALLDTEIARFSASGDIVKLYKFLTDYASGNDENGQPKPLRSLNAEDMARATRSKIGAVIGVINSAEKAADYQGFKTRITVDGITQKVTADFEGRVYAPAITDMLIKYRAMILNRVCVSTVKASLSGQESLAKIVEVASAYSGDSPAIRSMLENIAMAQTTYVSFAKTELEKRTLGEIDKPLPSGKVPAVLGVPKELQAIVSAQMPNWALQQEQKLRADILRRQEEIKSRIKENISEKESAKLRRLFQEGSVVQLSYGEHASKAQAVLWQDIVTRIDDFVATRMNFGALTIKEVEMLGNANLAVHALSDGPFRRIADRINQYGHDYYGLANIVDSFGSTNNFKQSPEIVSRLENPDYGRGPIWSNEQLLERWSGTVAAVMLERLRLEKPGESKELRSKIIADKLGLKYANYINISMATEELANYQASLKMAQEHLFSVGFSQDEIQRVSEDLIVDPATVHLLEISDRYLFNKGANPAYLSIEDVSGTGHNSVSLMTTNAAIIGNQYDTWANLNPTDRAEQVDLWLESSTVRIEIGGLHARFRQGDDVDPTHGAEYIELPIKDVLPADANVRFKEALRTAKKPSDFSKAVVVMMNESEELYEGITRVNDFVQTLIFDLVNNPSHLEKLGIDATMINSVGWLNIIHNVVRGKFSKPGINSKDYGASEITDKKTLPRRTYGGLTREQIEKVFEYGKQVEIPDSR